MTGTKRLKDHPKKKKFGYYMGMAFEIDAMSQRSLKPPSVVNQPAINKLFNNIPACK